MNKKNQQSEFRKNQILQIALDQFIERGFYGTSTRGIAEIAGISSGLLFHYFSSKEALYEALIEIGCNEMVLEEEQAQPAIEILEKKVEDFLALIKRNSFSAKMFVFMEMASMNAKDISSKAAELIEEHDIVAQSISLIEQGQKEGSIREGNPEALSVTFYSCIQGIAQVMAAKPETVLPEKQWILSIIKK